MKAPKLNAVSVVVAAFILSATQLFAADVPRANDVTPQFASANLPIAKFEAVEVGGIVILRGDATNVADAQRAGEFASSIGFTRVANLVRVVDPVDDPAIQRNAERQLGTRRLAGGNTHI